MMAPKSALKEHFAYGGTTATIYKVIVTNFW